MKPATAVASAATVVLVLGAGAVQAGATAPASSAHHPTAVQLFDRWNASLATGNPETVADQYAGDAVLLPTAAGHVHDTRAEIVQYFQGFLALQPRGTLVETKQRSLGGKALVLSGLYDFAVVRGGTRRNGAGACHVRLREARSRLEDRRAPLVEEALTR